MSNKERQRKAIMDSVRTGQLSLQEAAERLKISAQQSRRIYWRYCRSGDSGLVHGNCRKPSNRRYGDAFRATVLERYQTRYLGFGPPLAVEKLSAEGHILSDETLRLWLKAEGLSYRTRKHSPYRKRRDRKPGFGTLLQLDGSHHAWFGAQVPACCLMNLVDDATGTTLSLMAEQETTHAAMTLLKSWIERYGIPKALYVDLKTVYVSPKRARPDEEPTENSGFTHFSHACERLGIRIIKAYSPQAKGRVERNHAVYQDRFVKELKLQNTQTIEGANRLLAGGFIDALNTRFAKAPQDPIDQHRDPKDYGDLDQIFCWEQTRVIQKDWTFRFQKGHYQIVKTKSLWVRPKHRVTIREHLEGPLSVWFQEERLKVCLIPELYPRQTDFQGDTSSDEDNSSGSEQHGPDNPCAMRIEPMPFENCIPFSSFSQKSLIMTLQQPCL